MIYLGSYIVNHYSLNEAQPSTTFRFAFAFKYIEIQVPRYLYKTIRATLAQESILD